MYAMHIFNKTLTDNNFTSGLRPNDVYTSANFKINNIGAPMYVYKSQLSPANHFSLQNIRDKFYLY